LVLAVAVLMFLSALIYGTTGVIFLTGVYVVGVSVLIALYAMGSTRWGAGAMLAILVAGYIPAYFFYRWKEKKHRRAVEWLS
jgi:hypothetical protein